MKKGFRSVYFLLASYFMAVGVSTPAFSNSPAAVPEPAQEQGEEEVAPAAPKGKDKSKADAHGAATKPEQHDGAAADPHSSDSETGEEEPAAAHGEKSPDSAHGEPQKDDHGAPKETNEHKSSEAHPVALGESKGTGLYWFAGAIVVMVLAVFLFT